MGGQIKNLTGMRFGKLTAIEATKERRGSSVVWKCSCDCGNISYVKSYNLTSGNTRSCGCSGKAMKDLTGIKFGRLTAIEATKERQGSSVVWKCSCDCGNIAYASANYLRKGKIKSCGCLRKELPKDSKGKVHTLSFDDLTGNRYGKLTVLDDSGQRKNGERVWECLCDCGNISFHRTQTLKHGQAKSCGCERGGRRKKIYQYSLSDQFIREFDSITKASECLDISSTSIINCAKGRIKSVGGFVFKYTAPQKISGAKKIYQYSLDGQLICEFNSATQASKELDLSLPNISACATGRKKTSGGYVFSYTELSPEYFKPRAPRKDLSGQKFGLLTVLEPTNKRHGSNVVWKCLCKCGNIVEVPTTYLTSGDTKSCGCLHKKIMADMHKKNAEKMIGKKIGLLTVIRDTGKRSPDQQIIWECQCRCGNTTEVLNGNLREDHTTSCGCVRKEKFYDKGPNKLEENRKKMFVEDTNIYKLTRSQREKLAQNNTSGVTGVCYNKKTGYWMAYIGFKGGRYDLGQTYRQKQDAVKARRIAEEKLHGPFLDWYATAYPSEWKKNLAHSGKEGYPPQSYDIT